MKELLKKVVAIALQGKYNLTPQESAQVNSILQEASKVCAEDIIEEKDDAEDV